MGLDMYLHAREFVAGGYEHVRKAAADGHEGLRKTVEQFDAVTSAFGLDRSSIPEMTSFNIEFNVAYWRKANSIHGWFVKNIQDGTDDCGEYPVSRIHLEELVTICRRILVHSDLGDPVTVEGWGDSWEEYPDAHLKEEGRKIADELLPPQSGFFFGGTEHGESYISDLEDTVRQLTSLLENEKLQSFEFTYRSSW